MVQLYQISAGYHHGVLSSQRQLYDIAWILRVGQTYFAYLTICTFAPCWGYVNFNLIYTLVKWIKHNWKQCEREQPTAQYSFGSSKIVNASKSQIDSRESNKLKEYQPRVEADIDVDGCSLIDMEKKRQRRAKTGLELDAKTRAKPIRPILPSWWSSMETLCICNICSITEI